MNKMKIFLAIIFLSSAFLVGCLTTETKEYSFKIRKDGSGTAKIKYINLMSDQKDSAGIPESDYKDLVENYLNGKKLEDEFPGALNVKKKLFEEDNQLCGEITFDFKDIKPFKFYKYKDGPWCYYLNSSPFSSFSGNESYFSSNGEWGGENMPVIFWDGSEKEFQFKTTVTAPGKNTVSLIDYWNRDKR